MRKIYRIILVSVGMILILITADYFNLPSNIGFDMPSLNWDFLGILIGNFVVLFLYIITYLLIDHRNIKRNENQVRNIKLILADAYTQCKNQIELFDKKEIVKSAAKKCNFNVLNFQDPVLTQIQEMPFELEQYILDSSNSGILSKAEFQAFLNIRKEYKSYISFKITFFDAEEHTDNQEVQNELTLFITQKRDSLLKSIDTQLSVLQYSTEDSTVCCG